MVSTTINWDIPKLITKVASASFLLALMLASEATAESRLPPCPEDRNVSWDNCHGTVTFTDGVEYVGEFKDGKLNGQGTQTVPDGRKYVGEFKDGKPNGQGTLTFPEGGKYVGEWKDSQSTGQGTLTWPDGVEYVGEFKDNKYNGQGTLTWPDGGKYVGEFKDGNRNGQGTDTWPDGFKYVGGFKDGKRNGPGTLYPSDGSVIQSGIWKNDTLVEPSADYSPNKETTRALGLPEKTDGYLFLILLAIAAIAGIAAIFLMKDRTEPSIRVSSPTAATKVPATELVESDPENGPRPVDDAAMDAWRASLEPPESRPHQPEQVVQQPSLTSGKVMDFQTAIKTCFNKYTIFNGRASRSEYWFFILGTSVVGLATKIIDDALFVPSEKILKPIWGLIIMLPTLAVTVRRLHDMGRSGWLLWYYNIILVIFIVIFVELLASIRDKDVFDRATDFGGIGFIVALGFVSYFLSLPGTPGPNQYGDDPLVSASQDAAQVNYRASKTHEQNRTTTDNLALLERFYDLRQTGILTDAEFEQQKERILGG